MKIILVWNPKGGSGKSTGTVHLATAAEYAGDGPVIITDTDDQGTAADWSNERRKAGFETPRYAGLTIAGLDARLTALDAAGARYLFIDMHAQVSAEDKELLARADLVLIPLNPSPADLRALVKVLPLIRDAGKRFHFMLARVRPGLRNNEGTALALSALGLVLPTRMHERVIYGEAFGHGKTALDLDPASTAALEVMALWRDLKEKVESRKE